MRSAFLLALAAALLTALGQVLLKAGVHRHRHLGWHRAYLNPASAGGYALLLAVTFLNMRAFAVLPFKYSAIVLPVTYLGVGLLSRLVFGERLNRTQGFGALVVIAGIAVFFL
jgi:drug/metabolite transporter (DMT)-like permease